MKQWFSAISYYRVNSFNKDNTVNVHEKKDSNSELQMARDILETEMNSSLVFDSEQKVSRTEMLNKLLAVGEKVFTVTFNKKVDDEHIRDILSTIKKSGKTDLKKLSKEIVTGKECQMSCHMASSEHQLGRSQVLDLNAPHGRNFRQVDHRTINSLIVQNVKYVVQ